MGMKRIFNSNDKYMDINETEILVIRGDYNDFNFEIQLFSETFDAYIPQDTDVLMTKYPEKYEKLLKKVEAYLMNEGTNTPLLKGYGN